MTAALVLVGPPAHAVCVGDCSGTGMVSIDELVLGVNIALNLRPPSACVAFQNAQGQVDITQLIQGVNNSLQGCPPEATATATATNEPAASATSTASVAPVDTPTGTPPPSPTAVDTATATIALPTATETPVSTGTATPVATATPTDTAPMTPVATATITDTAGPTATPTLTVTPTATEFPVGVSIAGRAALLSSGLGGIGPVVSAIIIAQTNDGSAEAVVLDETRAHTAVFPRGTSSCLCPPPPKGTQCVCCPVDGYSTRACTAVEDGIEIVFGANACTILGPPGGTAVFDGAIAISAEEGSCPFAFDEGTYSVDALTTVFHNDELAETLSVSADLNGMIEPTASGTTCQISALALTLNGALTSELPDGTQVIASFDGASVTAEQIVYGPDCVPLSYKLTFSGSTTFTLQPSGNGFIAQFTGFVLDYAAMPGAADIELTGTLGSTCFGGGAGLTTASPLTVLSGQLCPHNGRLNVSGTGGAMAVTTYQDGQVTVDQGGNQSVFPSCLDAELLMCP